MSDPGPPPPFQPGPPNGPYVHQVPYPQGPYPQGPAGAPIYPAGAQPPKKRRRAWPWIVGVLLLFVLGIGGCSAAIFFATKGPIDKANEFLGLLDDGRYDDAFDLTDPACFTDGELADIRAFFTQYDIQSYDLNGVERTNGDGAASGTINLSEVGERAIRLELTNDGGWRVCSIDVNGP